MITIPNLDDKDIGACRAVGKIDPSPQAANIQNKDLLRILTWEQPKVLFLKLTFSIHRRPVIRAQLQSVHTPLDGIAAYSVTIVEDVHVPHLFDACEERVGGCREGCVRKYLRIFREIERQACVR